MRRQFQLPLFLIALAIALVVKTAVYESERPSERVIEAQVTYNSPAGDVVLYDLVEKVRVGVQGQANEIIQLSPFTVEVVVDVEAGRTGPTDITLEGGNVRFRAPGDFDVVSIEPKRFSIQMERRAEETVQVRAQLVGEPAAGARPGGVVVRPAWAEISGPESKVRGVAEVVAEVSLDGHARTFEDHVPVLSPHPLIQVQPGRVIVEVTMEEPELDLSIESLERPLGGDREEELERPLIGRGGELGDRGESQRQARAKDFSSDQGAKPQAYRSISRIWQRRAGGKDPLSARPEFCHGLLEQESSPS